VKPGSTSLDGIIIAGLIGAVMGAIALQLFANVSFEVERRLTAWNTSWEPLGSLTGNATNIIEIDNLIPYIETESGTILQCDGSCTNVDSRDIVVDNDSICKHDPISIRLSSPAPPGNVTDKRTVFYCYGVYSEQVEFVVLDDRSVHIWSSTISSEIDG
jgi:hypothetical protein